MKVPTVGIKGKLTSPHPWVWRTRLERDSVPRRFDPGGVVKVVDGDGQPVGRGFLHPHVTIGLRILTRDIDEEIDQAFFKRRFAAAKALREGLGLEDVGNGYRLCHSESDDLSGLMVDVLGDVVRVDCFAKGMASLQHPIRAALEELLLLDPGDRKVREFARPKQLEPAARSLLGARRVVVTAGFPVVAASGGLVPETDGPGAARALGGALRTLGCDVRYACGPMCAALFEALGAEPLDVLDQGAPRRGLEAAF